MSECVNETKLKRLEVRGAVMQYARRKTERYELAHIAAPALWLLREIARLSYRGGWGSCSPCIVTFLRLLPEDASRWTGAPILPWGRRAAPSQLSAGGSVLRLLPRRTYTLDCPHRSTLEKHTYRLPSPTDVSIVHYCLGMEGGLKSVHLLRVGR